MGLHFSFWSRTGEVLGPLNYAADAPLFIKSPQIKRLFERMECSEQRDVSRFHIKPFSPNDKRTRRSRTNAAWPIEIQQKEQLFVWPDETRTKQIRNVFAKYQCTDGRM